MGKLTGPSGKFRYEALQILFGHTLQLDTTSHKPISHVYSQLTKRYLEY